MPLRNERRARPRKATTEDIAKVALAQSGRAFTDVLAEPGADGDVLTADSAEEAGMKWATPAAPPAQVWELIGSYPISTAVATVEQTWTAGAYSQILVVASDISGSTSNVEFVFTLRNSGGAIVTLQTASAFMLGNNATSFGTGHARFTLGLDAATKYCNGSLFAASNLIATPVTINASGSNASAPDRARFNLTAGNVDDGVVLFYGLKAE